MKIMLFNCLCFLIFNLQFEKNENMWISISINRILELKELINLNRN